jgi:hypothetical protein
LIFSPQGRRRQKNDGFFSNGTRKMKKTPPIHLVDLAGPASLGDLCKGEEEDVRPVGKRERERTAQREREGEIGRGVSASSKFSRLVFFFIFGLLLFRFLDKPMDAPACGQRRVVDHEVGVGRLQL